MGDLSYHYKLHKKDLSDATKIEEIKQSIVSLKLSVNSYVIIDLPPKKSFPYLVFFQTARKRSFKTGKNRSISTKWNVPYRQNSTIIMTL